MIVTESGLSGLTKAYRSVLSAVGSPAISGASRWLDARPLSGVSARPTAATPVARTAVLRSTRCPPCREGTPTHGPPWPPWRRRRLRTPLFVCPLYVPPGPSDHLGLRV